MIEKIEFDCSYLWKLQASYIDILPPFAPEAFINFASFSLLSSTSAY